MALSNKIVSLPHAWASQPRPTSCIDFRKNHGTKVDGKIVHLLSNNYLGKAQKYVV